jgi:hypothetical protein
MRGLAGTKEHTIVLCRSAILFLLTSPLHCFLTSLENHSLLKCKHSSFHFHSTALRSPHTTSPCEGSQQTAWFEPTISAAERPQTNVSDRTATGTHTISEIESINCHRINDADFQKQMNDKRNTLQTAPVAASASVIRRNSFKLLLLQACPN